MGSRLLGSYVERQRISQANAKAREAREANQHDVMEELMKIMRPGQAAPQDGHGGGEAKRKGPAPRTPRPVTRVSWDDIIGQDEAKRALQEAVELPHLHPELYKFYGIKPPKGVLLYGPPGNGKTMLGKAIAAALAERFKSAEDGFRYIGGPELQDKYVGETEKKIREIFGTAKEFYVEHGFPSVIFLDEAECMLGKRGKGPHYRDDVVAQFLTEMDGLEDSGAIVILATNRPSDLDPAILREGRMDIKIAVPRPEREDARKVLLHYLGKIPLSSGHEAEDTANRISRALYSSDLTIQALEGGGKFIFGNLVNPAMLNRIVKQAATFAMRRDIEGKATSPSGVTYDDVFDSFSQVVEQNMALDHSDEIKTFQEMNQAEKIGLAI